MPSAGLEPDEDSNGADAEIEAIFRRKIVGLRARVCLAGVA